MMHLDLSGGVLASSLQGLDLFAILGITAALVLGGMVKGLTGLSPRTFRVIVLLFVLAAAVLMIWKSGVLRTGG
jgi:hypothetical protein